MRRSTLTGAAGVVAAFLGSLCCVGPLLFVTLGIGAGMASAFEPLRPFFGAAMLALLGAGFWTVYGRRRGTPQTEYPVGGASSAASASFDTNGDPVCAPGSSCAVPVRHRRDAIILWTATALALVLWTFPTWSLWLL